MGQLRGQPKREYSEIPYFTRDSGPCDLSNTVSKAPVALRSSASADLIPFFHRSFRYAEASFFIFCACCTAGPRGTAAAVEAANAPPERFLNTSTVLQEIISLCLSAAHGSVGGFFFGTRVEFR